VRVASHPPLREGGKERGREGGREDGREGGREEGRKEGNEGRYAMRLGLGGGGG
jgi:hypothetical protein